MPSIIPKPLGFTRARIGRLRQIRFPKPLSSFGLGLASVFCLTAFFCSEPESGRKPIPLAPLTGFELILKDAGLGELGVRLKWDFPDTMKISYFEALLSTRADSLGLPLTSRIPADAREWVLALPDSAPPFTVYAAIRPVEQLSTGQSRFGDSLAIDSLRIAERLTLLQPSQNQVWNGRVVVVRARFGNDRGYNLRQQWWSAAESDTDPYSKGLDTCFPRNHCNPPFFGTQTVEDTVLLSGLEPTEIAKQVLCLFATESYQGNPRGLRQGLGCVAFTRRDTL
jgi:hypothetical protein